MAHKPKEFLAVTKLANEVSALIDAGKIKFFDDADREQFYYLMRTALYDQLAQMQNIYNADREGRFLDFVTKNYEI